MYHIDVVRVRARQPRVRVHVAEARSGRVQRRYPADAPPGQGVERLASEPGYVAAETVADYMDQGRVLTVWNLAPITKINVKFVLIL